MARLFNSYTAWLLLCLVCLLAGHGAGRGMKPSRSLEIFSSRNEGAGGQPVVPDRVPADKESLESLLQAPADEECGRYAVWLERANLDEVRALWERYSKQGYYHSQAKPLILARWARLDPADYANQRTKLGRDGAYWTAWAMVDPAAVLAAARTWRGTGPSWEVVRVISTMFPGHARAFLENTPLRGAEGKYLGIPLRAALAESATTGEMAVLVEQDCRTVDANDSMLFAQWMKKSPESALDWLQSSGKIRSVGEWEYHEIAAMVQMHPEKADALIRRLPVGRLRAVLEAERAMARYTENPNQAWQLAREIPSREIRYDSLIQLALQTARQDPARAAAIHREISTAMWQAGKIQWPDPNFTGESSSSLWAIKVELGELKRVLQAVAPDLPLEDARPEPPPAPVENIDPFAQ